MQRKKLRRLGHSLTIPSKNKWAELIWGKGWLLDDNYWRAVNTMNKENDLLNCTMEGTRYTVWWQLTDIAHHMVKECECIARILCHTSLLKVDDYRLKDSPHSSRTCELCNQYALESIHHLLMQCPGMHEEQKGLHEQLSLVAPEIIEKFAEEPQNSFFG